MESGQLIQFGNIWAAVFALGFFTVIALVIGLGTGRLMHKGLLGEGAQVGLGGKLFCTLCGVALSLGILVMLYFTSLDGYYSLEVRDSQIMLHYLFPPRTAVLRQDEIRDIDVVTLDHGQARLVFELTDGSRVKSARDSSEIVFRSRQDLPANAAPLIWRGRSLR